MGGKVYADLTSQLNHLGQHTFAGNFGASMQAQGLL
jgi:D-Tyr-tRNAtyr deacylase